MGGNILDVKRLFFKWDFYPVYFRSSWPFTSFALLKINVCFKHLEASDTMACDS